MPVTGCNSRLMPLFNAYNHPQDNTIILPAQSVRIIISEFNLNKQAGFDTLFFRYRPARFPRPISKAVSPDKE